jgi:hypothetical protein
MQRPGFTIANSYGAVKSGSSQRLANTLRREDQIKTSSETTDRALRFWRVRVALEK